MWSTILAPLKHSSGSILDILLMMSCGLMAIHGVLGIYYAMTTHYSNKDFSGSSKFLRKVEFEDCNEINKRNKEAQ